MTDPLFFHSVAALIAGILILIVPRILNYVVAAYLILIGLAGLLPALTGGGTSLAGF